MGITEYNNKNYVKINGIKVEHLCNSCMNKDTNWRARLNCVKLYCVDYQPIPEFVLEEEKNAKRKTMQDL